MSKRNRKPPLGIMPRVIWDEINPYPTFRDKIKRFFAVISVSSKYIVSGRLPCKRWFY